MGNKGRNIRLLIADHLQPFLFWPSSIEELISGHDFVSSPNSSKHSNEFGYLDSKANMGRIIFGGYWLDNRRLTVRVTVGTRIFTSPYHPKQFWSPLSL
jgi:hypothetical protein